MPRRSITDLAERYNVSVLDVRTVAEVELDEPHYDFDDYTVDDEGWDELVTHFEGGQPR